jgi:glycosyltransferase involved in cell wall biosynthesis
MHVCFDVSPTAQKHAGLGRYAGELSRALAADNNDMELLLFYNRQGNARLPDYLRHIPQKSVISGNKPWRLRVLLSQLAHWPMDKSFGVYTLHDLIFLKYPQYHLPYNRWYLTFSMPRYLRAADIVVTPSECSRQDAINYYSLPESKIRVIYEAAAPSFKPAADQTVLNMVRQKYNLPPKYILHVGTIEPRKNLSRLLDVFKSLLPDWPELRLVLVGQKGWLYASFFQHLEELGLLVWGRSKPWPVVRRSSAAIVRVCPRLSMKPESWSTPQTVPLWQPPFAESWLTMRYGLT